MVVRTVLEQFLLAHLNTLLLRALLILHGRRARCPNRRRRSHRSRLPVARACTIGLRLWINRRAGGDTSTSDLRVDLFLHIGIARNRASCGAVGRACLCPFCSLLELGGPGLEMNAADRVGRDELGGINEPALERAFADLQGLLRLLHASGLVQELAATAFDRLSEVSHLELSIA